MKKKVLLLALVLLMLIPSVAFGATSYNDGLIDDVGYTVEVESGTAWSNPSNMFDNDLATYSGATSDGWMRVNFNSPVDIENVYIDWEKVASENFRIWFFDSSNTELLDSDSTVFIDGEYTPLPQSVTSVSYIWIDSTSATNVYELEFAGEIVPTDGTAPADVTNLSATPSDGKVTLTWSNPVDADLSHFKIYQDGLMINSTEGDVSPLAEFVDVIGLTNGTAYTFKVTSVDTSGNESTGATVSSTPVAAADTTPPSNVTDLNLSATDTTIDVTYLLPSDDDFDHVVIYVDGVEHGTTMLNSYQITSLNAGTSYSIKVTTVDTLGNESSGSVKTITTNLVADTTAPSTPTGLTITSQGSRSAIAEWDMNTETDIKGYNIYVDGVKHNSLPITTTSYSITGLENDVTYSIQVSALDLSGNESALSLGVNAIPSADSIPVVSMDYELVDVADGVTNWFTSLWLILAFAVAIPLAFYIANRIKLLFMD